MGTLFLHPEALVRSIIACLVAAIVTLSALPARAADEPDLIFKRSTVFKPMGSTIRRSKAWLVTLPCRSAAA
jgi:hypothetical protein